MKKQILIFRDKCERPYHIEIRRDGKLCSNHYNIATHAEAVEIALSEYKSRDMYGQGSGWELSDYSETTIL